jgi:hypothetical protein
VGIASFRIFVWMSVKFNAEDLQQMQERGSSVEVLQRQVELLENGVVAPLLIAACTPSDGGIKILSDEEKKRAIAKFELKHNDLSIKRFVPASGAASRMFKALLKHAKGKSSDSSEEFLQNLEHFPFWAETERILRHKGQSNDTKVLANNPSVLWDAMLLGGLNYAEMPKGMIPFHFYPDGSRTAFAEQLYEASWYAENENGSHTHFTLPESRISLIRHHLDEVVEELSKKGIRASYSFSLQHTSTDTIALGQDNQPFREESGKLLFRPGGHGALIHNLAEIEADLVFIKNIDNVVPDAHKAKALSGKKVLAGIALDIREKTGHWIDLLESSALIDWQKLNDFIRNTLMIRGLEIDDTDVALNLLNRPLRVCGMVKNEGEPGGGPFWVKMSDGSIRPQIIEKAQIDLEAPHQNEILNASTHFNPVDIVALLRDHRGNSYQILDFVDEEMAFITEKSYLGKSLKVLEHPGLWNGGMAYWNTVFVQVSLDSFNPVKTVNDLLRPAHRVILAES